jgi:hypothetical protein
MAFTRAELLPGSKDCSMDLLTIVRDAQPELDGWRQRAGRMPPEEPERDSDLARDDKMFVHHRISEVVRFSLASAGEHLRLVWDGLNQGHLYATAQYTAVRGALVGAAQAVWITEPDDPSTRQRRGHVVIADMYQNLRKYHRCTLDLARQLGFTPDDEQRVNEQIAWIESRELTLKAVQPAPMKLNLTDVLKDIAPIVFPNDQKHQAHLRLAWKQLSSDTHVLMWSVAQRTDFTTAGPPDRASGLSVGIAGGDPTQLVVWYELIMRALRRGWNLFDRRCEGR